MGGGGARRDSLGAGVKTVTAGWLLRDPSPAARWVHFYGRCVAGSAALVDGRARLAPGGVALAGNRRVRRATLLPEDDAGGWMRGGAARGKSLEGRECRENVLEGKAAGKVLELLHARVRVLHSRVVDCLVATRPAVVIEPANDPPPPRSSPDVTSSASARYPARTRSSPRRGSTRRWRGSSRGCRGSACPRREKRRPRAGWR